MIWYILCTLGGFLLGVCTLAFVAWAWWGAPENKFKTVVLRSNSEGGSGDNEKELIRQLKRSTNYLQSNEGFIPVSTRHNLYKIVNDNRKLIAKCKSK